LDLILILEPTFSDCMSLLGPVCPLTQYHEIFRSPFFFLCEGFTDGEGLLKVHFSFAPIFGHNHSFYDPCTPMVITDRWAPFPSTGLVLPFFQPFSLSDPRLGFPMRRPPRVGRFQPFLARFCSFRLFFPDFFPFFFTPRINSRDRCTLVFYVSFSS